MKRPVGWALLMVGLAGLVAVLTVAPGAATPPSGLTNIASARGTNVSGNIPLQVGTDVAMAQITVNPAGSSGWHSHPGGAIIVVQTGTLTVYRSLGSQCQHTTYSAGQAFIERPGEVNNVINTGTVPYCPVRHLPTCASGAWPRESTSRIPVRARGSDDLTERDVPCDGDVGLRRHVQRA